MKRGKTSGDVSVVSKNHTIDNLGALSVTCGMVLLMTITYKCGP